MASGQRSVWITRAEPGAGRTARGVAALGLQPIIAPLLHYCDLETPLDLKSGQALAFTSSYGAQRAATLTPERDMTVFAVGEATAAAARAAGFTRAVSADGDVYALAAAIIAAKPEGGVLHPSALETAGDLVSLLNAGGVPARKAAVYETVSATVLPPDLADRIASGRLAVILLHSPKAARIAATLLLPGAHPAVTVFGLSDACLDPLRSLGFGAMFAARQPTEEALLERLKTWATAKP